MGPQAHLNKNKSYEKTTRCVLAKQLHGSVEFVWPGSLPVAAQGVRLPNCSAEQCQRPL